MVLKTHRSFFYICGEIVVKKHERNFTEFVKKGYFVNFGEEIGYRKKFVIFVATIVGNGIRKKRKLKLLDLQYPLYTETNEIIQMTVSFVALMFMDIAPKKKELSMLTLLQLNRL